MEQKTLKDLINSRDITIVELSHIVGLSRETLYKALRGKKLSFISTKKICNYFNARFEDYYKIKEL